MSPGGCNHEIRLTVLRVATETGPEDVLAAVCIECGQLFRLHRGWMKDWSRIFSQPVAES